MPCVADVQHLFEHAIDGLYNPPLPQIEFFPHADELVLHIVPDGRDELEALLEQLLEQAGKVSFVQIAFPLQATEHAAEQILVVVSHISRGEEEFNDLPELIDYQVQLEAEEPSCG